MGGAAAAKEGAEVEQPDEAVTLPNGRIQESERGTGARSRAEERQAFASRFPEVRSYRLNL